MQPVNCYKVTEYLRAYNQIELARDPTPNKIELLESDIGLSLTAARGPLQCHSQYVRRDERADALREQSREMPFRASQF
jgi:hypothetical protein